MRGESYGWNNPVKYTDPTGHCPSGDSETAQECRYIERIIKDTYGISISSNFDENTAGLLLSRFNDVANGVGGDHVFRYIWGGRTTVDLWDTGEAIQAVCGKDITRSCTNFSNINLTRDDLIFRGFGTVAHELGHAWDYLTKPNPRLKNVMDKDHGGLWQGMAELTGSRWAPQCGSSPCEQSGFTAWELGPDLPGSPSSYARNSAYDDWALSFQLVVTGDYETAYQSYSIPNWDARSPYVQSRINAARRSAPFP